MVGVDDVHADLLTTSLLAGRLSEPVPIRDCDGGSANKGSASGPAQSPPFCELQRTLSERLPLKLAHAVAIRVRLKGAASRRAVLSRTQYITGGSMSGAGGSSSRVAAPAACAAVHKLIRGAGSPVGGAFARHSVLNSCAAIDAVAGCLRPMAVARNGSGAAGWAGGDRSNQLAIQMPQRRAWASLVMAARPQAVSGQW